MARQLERYYAAAAHEAQLREVALPLRELEWMIAEPDNPALLSTALAEPGVGIIAEHKRRSPGHGDIAPSSNAAWTAEQYQRGGAIAVSVATQGADFDGSMEDLTAVRGAVHVPILRKDFIKTHYQLYDAKAHGAAAALLIVAGLSDVELVDLHEEAEAIGLECLVEVHDQKDLSRALQVGPRLMGINNRDLRTLAVDLNTTRTLIEDIPAGVLVVAESGYESREQMQELRSLGVDGALIGTSLMQAENPAASVQALMAS